jgi:hypothetical protein
MHIKPFPFIMTSIPVNNKLKPNFSQLHFSELSKGSGSMAPEGIDTTIT